MIASTHLTAGAAVGVLSYRYLFKSDSFSGIAGAAAIGIISHLLLDMIPHSEDEIYRPDGCSRFLPIILSAELAFTFLAIYLCGAGGLSLNYQAGYLLAGMVGGALPDVPHVLMESLGVDWWWLEMADKVNVFFHTSLHASSFRQGFFPQIIIIFISLSVLYYFRPDLAKATP